MVRGQWVNVSSVLKGNYGKAFVHVNAYNSALCHSTQCNDITYSSVAPKRLD